VSEAEASAARPAGTFGRAQRVRKRLEFQEIQAGGRRVTTAHFALVVYGRATAAGARLGITASRKVGNAVRRNRAKRLIREAFRATRELWPDDVDLVVLVRRAPQGMKLAEVVAEWQGAARTIRRRIREARKDRDRRQSALAQTT
jgi:ribonuclease P protein component